MSTVFHPRLTGDQRESLELLTGRPRNILTLHERLGLRGGTIEMRALCDAIDTLLRWGYIAETDERGFDTVRWRATPSGIETLNRENSR